MGILSKLHITSRNHKPNNGKKLEVINFPDFPVAEERKKQFPEFFEPRTTRSDEIGLGFDHPFFHWRREDKP
jgi:hypothetical protein